MFTGFFRIRIGFNADPDPAYAYPDTVPVPNPGF
jgi:hypothetical protein